MKKSTVFITIFISFCSAPVFVAISLFQFNWVPKQKYNLSINQLNLINQRRQQKSLKKVSTSLADFCILHLLYEHFSFTFFQMKLTITGFHFIYLRPFLMNRRHIHTQAHHLHTHTTHTHTHTHTTHTHTHTHTHTCARTHNNTRNHTHAQTRTYTHTYI